VAFVNSRSSVSSLPLNPPVLPVFRPASFSVNELLQ
jgi:hypothetical protein